MPKTVTIPTTTLERVLTLLAQQPLCNVFDVFVELKTEAEKSMREQQGEGRE